MGNAPSTSTLPQNCGPQLRDALKCLEALVLDGLRHGFFGCYVDCKVVKDQKRELVISAGKSHKFTIPEDELPH